MIPSFNTIPQPIAGTKTAQPVSAVPAVNSGRVLLALLLPQKPPPLILGEQVTARVAERLDNQRLVVLIKNGLFTLHLPKGLQLNSDILTLRVTTVKPELTFLLLESTAAAHTNDSPLDVLLSRASRYLTQLLQAGQAAPLAPKWLTLDAANQPPVQLAQAIKAWVEKSGVFYESHLKAWESGLLPLDALKNEPQASLKSSNMLLLGQLLHQQLHALENHQIPIQGYAWPGQLMSLLIEKEKTDERDGDGARRDEQAWSTLLALELPGLGGVTARLRMVEGAVQILFSATAQATVQLIQQYSDKLRQNFALAGLSLATVTVSHEKPPV